MRDDGRGLAKILVAAGVVEVPVRIEHELHRLVGDALESGPDLFGQRCVLVVDDEDSIISGAHADVAAHALQHVNRSRNFGDFDFDLGKIRLLLGGGGNRKKQQ